MLRKSLVEYALETDFVRFDRLLQLYPAFLFYGLRIRISDDYRAVSVRVPLRFYFRNNSGVMFGAAMATASDPFPALLLQKLLGPGTVAYTTRHSLEYVRPATSDVTMTVRIEDTELDEIRAMLESAGRGRRSFSYAFADDRGRTVARVTSTAYLRRVGQLSRRTLRPR